MKFIVYLHQKGRARWVISQGGVILDKGNGKLFNKHQLRLFGYTK